MLEPELKEYLKTINTNIEKVHKNANWWRSLSHGVFTGFGYVLGFVIAIVVLGWVLNIVGVIPAFRQEVNAWRRLLQQTQQQRLPNIQGSNTTR